MIFNLTKTYLLFSNFCYTLYTYGFPVCQVSFHISIIGGERENMIWDYLGGVQFCQLGGNEKFFVLFRNTPGD
jgi:hypothetical protein